MPDFGRNLIAMIDFLCENPYYGTQLKVGRPRYVVQMNTGTLDWTVILHYSIEEDSITLIGIHPAGS